MPLNALLLTKKILSREEVVIGIGKGRHDKHNEKESGIELLKNVLLDSGAPTCFFGSVSRVFRALIV